MEIIIKIKIENDEPVKVEVEQTEEKEEDQANSKYARFFDEANPFWSKDPTYNMIFLKQQQQYANELLERRGHLFLNEVYDMLGMPRTKAGQVVGWIFEENNPLGDNIVDFGLYKLDDSKVIVNGYERSVLIDPNVDGNILDRIK